MVKKKEFKFDSEATLKSILGGAPQPIEGQISVDELPGGADLPQAEVQPPVKVEGKKKGRPKMMREKKKRISFTILPSLHEQASEIAYSEGKNMSELISEFLAEYVESHK